MRRAVINAERKVRAGGKGQTAPIFRLFRRACRKSSHTDAQGKAEQQSEAAFHPLFCHLRHRLSCRVRDSEREHDAGRADAADVLGG